MTLTPDQIVAGLFGASLLVEAVARRIENLSFVKNRPSLERLVAGTQLAAGRIAQAIPPGTTAAQVESLVAGEAVKIATNYADSAKIAKADQAAIAGMVAGELGKLLPPGHILPGAPAAVQSASDQLVAELRSKLGLQAVADAGAAVAAG